MVAPDQCTHECKLIKKSLSCIWRSYVTSPERGGAGRLPPQNCLLSKFLGRQSLLRNLPSAEASLRKILRPVQPWSCCLTLCLRFGCKEPYRASVSIIGLSNEIYYSNEGLTYALPDPAIIKQSGAYSGCVDRWLQHSSAPQCDCIRLT